MQNIVGAYEDRDEEPSDGLATTAKHYLKKFDFSKVQLLIHAVKVLFYYLDQIKDIVLLAVMVEASGSDWASFETQFIAAWALTIVVPLVVNALYISSRATTSLGQIKRRYTRKTKMALKCLAFFVSWLIPASLIFKKDSDKFLSDRLKKDCLAKKKNLCKKKPLLLKKKSDIDRMREITTIYKVWGSAS